ncbi:MAG: hypothetical protein JW741_08365 [Sedimentisphaerales bacterium]|nr:hypothetical protein [Sedimentisphaerales bacterium]
MKKQAILDERSLRIATVVSAVAVLAVLAAALVANAMTKDVGRDEQMYCTAGALLSRGHLIYRDFAYPSQLPCHPLLLAGLYKTLGTSRFLLVGRLLSAVCDILVMLVIVGIFRSVFGPRRRAGLLFGMAAVAFYTFNPLVDYAAGYAWNHDAVILCVAASLWLFITTDFRQKSRYWRAALMGAVLTFATCMRITTAVIELVFLAALLVASGRSLRQKCQTALPFSAAGLVVLAWPAWVVAQAPAAFWVNLTQIPALYGQWLQDIGMTHNKVALTAAALSFPGYLVLLATAGYFAWVLCRRFAALDAAAKPKVVLAALLPVGFFLIAYVPPTMWRQYLAVPVPFLTIALAYPLAQLCNQARTGAGKTPFTVASYLVAIATAVTVLSYPVVLDRLPLVFEPKRWTPVELHRRSADIGNDVQEPRLVCTLGPLEALEGGCDVYPELACGSIVYRVADLMSPQQREVTHTVGTATLAALLEQRRPSAVMVGVESSHFSFLEEPLRNWVPADWLRLTYDNGLQVYLRP